MKVEKLIPEIYYKQSRDFSYIGRLLEIIFNYMKTGADSVPSNPDSPNIDATTVELVATTLGFESKHKYTTRDLIYIISSFSDLIKKKGTEDAINDAIRLLMNSQKIKIDLITDFVGYASGEGDDFTINIKIPVQLTDTVLLEDLFDYILPTGVLYRFNRVVPIPARASNFETITDTRHVYGENADTSQLWLGLSESSEGDNNYTYGGYVYVLVTDEPDDWSSSGVYYKYNDTNKTFDEKTESDTYTSHTFYTRELTTDIGTIITGTVADKIVEPEEET